MKNIKFRQIVGKEITYWGFFEDKFHSPIEGCPSDIYLGKDKNGAEIYENDICFYEGTPCSHCHVVDTYTDNIRGNYLIKLYDDDGTIYVCASQKTGKEKYGCFFQNEFSRLQIIGNIHQNSELLEEK